MYLSLTHVYKHIHAYTYTQKVGGGEREILICIRTYIIT
jgi:hypothetical protein